MGQWKNPVEIRMENYPEEIARMQFKANQLQSRTEKLLAKERIRTARSLKTAKLRKATLQIIFFTTVLLSLWYILFK